MAQEQGTLFVANGVSSANAAVTATQAAATGKQHCIESVTVSASGVALAAAVLCQIKDGTTVIDQFYLGLQPGAITVPLNGYRATVGNLVSATLAACGAGILGTVSIRGYTL